MTRIALDTNILAYLCGVVRVPADDTKVRRARDIIKGLGRSGDLVAPVQTLGELFVVLRRSGITAVEARALVVEMADAFAAPASALPSALAALDLAVDHQLQLWDALIVSVAVKGGCSLLLSEDMQDGFVVQGLTIVNPLAASPHPRLAALL